MAEEAKTEEKNEATKKEEYEDFEENESDLGVDQEEGSQEETEEIAKLAEKLEDKDKKIEELKSRIQHLQADFENYKRRHRQETEEKKLEGMGEVIMDIVPAYDNLDRAFQSFERNDDAESFIEGVEKIYAQFSDVLNKRDVEPIEAEGEKFDPKKHQALMKVESDDDEHNVITEEFERGYKFKGKVLKPSKVKVNLNPTEEEK